MKPIKDTYNYQKMYTEDARLSSNFISAKQQ